MNCTVFTHRLFRASIGIFASVFLLMSLCSCVTDHLVISYGAESLKRLNVQKTAAAYEANRPTTVQEMIALIGHPPMGRYKDKQRGEYYYWMGYEESYRGGHQQATVSCLVKNGKIEKSYLIYYPFDFMKAWIVPASVTLGDKDLMDLNLNPGLLIALKPSFHEKEMKRGLVRGQEVAISPSGNTVYLVARGAKVVGWVGETPNLVYNNVSTGVTNTYGNNSNQMFTRGLFGMNNGYTSPRMPVSSSIYTQGGTDALSEYVKHLQQKADEDAKSCRQLKHEIDRALNATNYTGR